MSKGTDLIALAEQCEKATGPDRELDHAIWLAVVATDEQRNTVEAGRDAHGDTEAYFRTDYMMGGYAFTASLDAAMSLKGDWMLDYIQETDEGYSTAGLYRRNGIVLSHDRATGNGKTPALPSEPPMTQDNSTAQLLPCPTPFCAVPEPFVERVGSHLFKVRCKYCNVETEVQFNEAAAIEQWNTRAPVSQDAAQLVERLHEIVGIIEEPFEQDIAAGTATYSADERDFILRYTKQAADLIEALTRVQPSTGLDMVDDGRSPSGPGSRPSDRAAESVSPVPASIPSATKPA